MKLGFNIRLGILLQKGILGRFLKAINRLVRRVFGDTKLYEYTFARCIRYITRVPFNMDIGRGNNNWSYGIIREESPLVSVVVPCYNHVKYLRRRLDSIYHQTYRNYEVILLDDSSTDGSQDIIREYAKRYSENTRVCLNEKNGGRPFLQWRKGIDMANGELAWIAESDDSCELNYLEEMVRPFSDSIVMLAFSNMMIVSANEQRAHSLNSEESYAVAAATFAKDGLAYECLLINVSGTVFRKPAVIPDEVIDLCSNIKVASDWLFYLWISKGGCIAHVASTSNYFTKHEGSTSYHYGGSERYFVEHEKIAYYIANNYVTPEDWSYKYMELLYI